MATDFHSLGLTAGPHVSHTPGRLHATCHRPDGHDAVVVQVAGDVDEHTAPDLARLLLPCLASGPDTVVADFGETDFLGVAGLELLLHARSRARFQDTQLWLAAPSPAVQRALEVSGIKRLFQTTPIISAGLARPEPAAAAHAL